MTTLAPTAGQLVLPMDDIDPAEEAARRLLRRYVKLGHNPRHIKESCMGECTVYWAQIGGWCDPGEEFGPNKHYSTDHIIVNRDVNGVECVRIFKFWDIWKSLQQEA